MERSLERRRCGAARAAVTDTILNYGRELGMVSRNPKLGMVSPEPKARWRTPVLSGVPRCRQVRRDPMQFRAVRNVAILKILGNFKSALGSMFRSNITPFMT